MENNTMISNALDIIINKGFKNIRADYKDYEKPAKLKLKGSDQEVIPDFTAKEEDGKYYFEIVRKAKRDKKAVVHKWTLLSTLANLRNGKFILLVPHGTLTYTRKLVEEHNIDAEIIKI
ncbi:MAG: hypothetical protein ACOCWM_04410 [Cyclobacteriaceae bacterium]